MINNRKKEQGITLIALVVTIIVLLILAGTTISMLTGDNGLINKAGEAKKLTEEAAEKEKVQLTVMAANKEHGITDESLQKACDIEFGENKTKSKAFADGSVTILVTDTGKEYYMDKNGSITMTNTTAIDDNEQKGFSGAGTSSNPYKISSIEDLVYLGEQVASGTNYSGKSIELTRDLDFRSLNSYINAAEVDEETGKDLITSMTTGEGFTPIGDGSHEFKGKLDGKGCKIKNLYQNRTESSAGLFGNLGGIVSNLLLKNVKIYSKGSNICVGCIAMSCSGSIKGCFVDGDISCLEDNWNISAVGGLVGKVTHNCIIEDCIFNGQVLGNVFTRNGGHIITGGIVGEMSGNSMVKNCMNYANVTMDGYGFGYTRTGGLVGRSMR